MLALRIFKQLAGSWSFERTIQNFLDPALSGTVNGTAKFIPKSEKQYLYHEEGNFKTESKKSFQMTKSFLYCFDTNKQSITVHALEDQKSSGELFALTLNPTQDCLVSQATHLCAQDLYQAKFDFPATEPMDQFFITYTVQGPQKNYISDTVFKRLKR